MSPSRQHLHADNSAVVRVDDRLVPGLDFAGRDGSAQLRLKVEPAVRLVSQRGVERTPMASTLGLDAVEGHIGEPLQLAGLARIARVHGPSDAGAGRHAAPVDRMRLSEQPDQLFRARIRVGGVRDQGELVAAQPRRPLARPAIGAQTTTHLGEEQVAGMMPHGVVEVLEVIQVNDEKDDLSPFPGGRFQLFAKGGCERAAVHQPGEAVGLRQAQGQGALGFQLRDARRQFGKAPRGVMSVG